MGTSFHGMLLMAVSSEAYVAYRYASLRWFLLSIKMPTALISTHSPQTCSPCPQMPRGPYSHPKEMGAQGGGSSHLSSKWTSPVAASPHGS